MNILVDAQLPPSLAGWLRDRGHSAQHVDEAGLLGASDNAIWLHALATDAVLITKDRDFADWALKRLPAPTVVWVRTGNMSNRDQQPRFLQAWTRALVRLAKGDRLIEMR